MRAAWSPICARRRLVCTTLAGSIRRRSAQLAKLANGGGNGSNQHRAKVGIATFADAKLAADPNVLAMAKRGKIGPRLADQRGDKIGSPPGLIDARRPHGGPRSRVGPVPGGRRGGASQRRDEAFSLALFLRR
jgi:hypothetical protein